MRIVKNSIVMTDGSLTLFLSVSVQCWGMNAITDTTISSSNNDVVGGI